MKFKEGISVEVLRKEKHVPYGSWFSGTIIAIDGDESIIRYKFLKDESGDFVEERVPKWKIRPQPQPQHDKITRKRWVVGEMTEVFDVNRWRIGKVAKVLRNERLVVKFFGSIQLKEFHVSSLRTCRVWHENKWSELGKEESSLSHSNQQETICEDETSSHQDEDALRNPKKDKRNGDLLRVPMQFVKRRHACDHKPASNKGLVSQRIQKKRTSKLDSEGHYTMPLTTIYSSRQFGVSNSKPEEETDRMFSYECSVASCSLNETADCNARGGSHKLRLESSCHISDAESSFPALSCTKNTRPFSRHKLEVGTNVIHNLELQAYKSTVQALFASGPLSWEQETLLTNLRLSLHISNDEHLLQLRHLLSAQVL